MIGELIKDQYRNRVIDAALDYIKYRCKFETIEEAKEYLEENKNASHNLASAGVRFDEFLDSVHYTTGLYKD